MLKLLDRKTLLLFPKLYRFFQGAFRNLHEHVDDLGHFLWDARITEVDDPIVECRQFIVRLPDLQIGDAIVEALDLISIQLDQLELFVVLERAPQLDAKVLQVIDLLLDLEESECYRRVAAAFVHQFRLEYGGTILFF